ncbi:MAG: Smr/MutS family protein [Bacteroidota bacterium]
MKCYNAHTFEKLGFDLILADLSKRVVSEEAKARVSEIVPQTNPEWLLPELKRVSEFKEILEVESTFPTQGFVAVGRYLKKLEVQGNWLSSQEMFRLLRWLKGIAAVRSFFKDKEEDYPELVQLVQRHGFQHQLIQLIAGILDENGNIRDDASPELLRIRRGMKKTASSLRSTLGKILRQAQENNWTQESEISLRNERLVIPIRAEAKGRVPGFVQDVSQSGGTVYLEPAEALPLNNRLRELQIEEQNELIRILQQASAGIREHLADLLHFHELMIQLDVIRGKARQAQALNGIAPQVNPTGKRLRLRTAYYPLLMFRAKEEDFPVIPLDLNLTPKYRILLISGPNAGGKSVALKTVGLLQLMLQSGLLVPVDEGSEFRLFDSLFLDIGDEQSVDSDLSTYTSRLFQWRQMGDHMRENDLFLVDEFGSGTDPKQGGAIAEAFLERFVRQRAMGIITTHYGNLKDYAANTSSLINGAMQFDTEELRPTFHLIEGLPGRSYAFEMAKRVGVHPSILRNARKKVGTEEVDSERLLKELEQKNVKLNRLLAENQRRSDKLDRLLDKHDASDKELQRERKKLLREAKQEAKELIRQANKRIEQTIREIREAEAEKEKTLQLRKALAASAPELEPEEPVSREESPAAKRKNAPKGKKKSSKPVKKAGPNPLDPLPDQPLEVGSWVKWKQSQTYGQLEEVQGKRAIVSTGGMRLTVKLDQLVRIVPPKAEKTTAASTSLSTKNMKVSLEKNIMGLRVEAALPAVERWLDEAHLAGFRSLRLLHGKGTGALREAIRSQLHKLPYVVDMSDAPEDQGGAGWTLIELAE